MHSGMSGEDFFVLYESMNSTPLLLYMYLCKCVLIRRTHHCWSFVFAAWIESDIFF